jgi:hypothetical protein
MRRACSRRWTASRIPGERLAAVCPAYVRFAADRQALFQALFAAGLDKTRHAELDDAARPAR